jgi:hypothetical protein
MKTGKKLPAYAERLWINLQSNLIDFHKTLLEIFESEAWKPQYETFTEAWTDKMSNITFAPELLAPIAYQMFNEGATPDQVADSVKGIGPSIAEDLKQQKDNGVSVDQASTVVRRHRRKLPGDFGYIRIKVGRDTLKEWKRLANQHGMTVAGVALPAIADAFRELG